MGLAEVRRIAQEEVARTRQEFAQREQARSAEQVYSGFQQEAVKQAEAAGIDFEDDWGTLTELPKVSQPIAEYLFHGSENKALLVHHLAEHTDEVERISNLHPAQAFRELARLDLTLGSKRPNVTKAPAPGPTVGGRAVHARDWRQSNDMNEFAAGFQREQEERAKRGL